MRGGHSRLSRSISICIRIHIHICYHGTTIVVVVDYFLFFRDDNIILPHVTGNGLDIGVKIGHGRGFIFGGNLILLYFRIAIGINIVKYIWP